MKVIKYNNNPLGENCYLVIKNKSAIIIDPGFFEKELVEYIDNNNIHVEAILLTHGHFDHIGAVDSYYNQYKCPIYIDKYDTRCFSEAYFNLSKIDDLVVSPYNIYSEKLKLKEFDIKLVRASGHSKGSTLILIENLMFSGDVIFKGTVGRTDFNGSNADEMRVTLNSLKKMSSDYIVYPGHGDKTKLYDEFKSNPFLK